MTFEISNGAENAKDAIEMAYNDVARALKDIPHSEIMIKGVESRAVSFGE